MGDYGTRDRKVENMIGEIIVACASLLGTIIAGLSGYKLTAYRLQQLEKKVEKHNSFGEKIPVIQEQIKVINHRLEDLEHE